jgi:hypothetical protein
MSADEMPRRRWRRFGLRTLFVVMTVFGCGLSWLAVEVRAVRMRANLVAWCAAHGGDVDFTWGPENGTGCFCGPPPHVSWIRKLLGDRPVSSIYFLEGPESAPPASRQRELILHFPETDLAAFGSDWDFHNFSRD